METENQDSLKLDAKLWLKAHGFDYQWLAEKCYVSETTVRNWMARKPIPKAKEHIIRQLISQRPILMPGAGTSSVDVSVETVLTLRIDSGTRKNLENKAFHMGLTLEEYLAKVMNDICSD